MEEPADFGEPAKQPLVAASERLAARLELDALVAELYGLRPDDFAHIVTRFPIYDLDAGEYRYPLLALQVFEALYADGLDAARRRASELVVARGQAGVGFGLDELWVPDGGWELANREAREIFRDDEGAAA